MRPRTTIIAATLALLAGGAAWLWPAGDAPSAPAGKKIATQARATAPERLTASSVLAIDVSKPSVHAAGNAPPVPRTLAREFEQATALRPLYDRLLGNTQTPESKYVMYRILGDCAVKSGGKEARPPRPWAERRKALEESIPDGDPLKPARLKAFEELGRCAGMEDVTTSAEAMNRLLDEAAREGDPRARALQVQRDVFSDPTPRRGGPPISEAQLQALREAIASRDPAAIAIAGTVLSNTFGDTVIELADTRQAIDSHASRQAWRLLACDHGLHCGNGNRELRADCAFAGRCGAATVPDQIYFYETTPNQAQLVEQYRQVYRRAIDANDWSGLAFSRRPHQPRGVHTYIYPGP